MSKDLFSRVAKLSLERRRLLESIVSAPHALNGLRPRGDDRPAPLSSAQAQLWFLERVAPNRLDYLVCMRLHLDGPLDVGSLGAALTAMGTRHAVLRTRIIETPEGPCQCVDPATAVPLVVEIGPPEPPQPFDLTRGPLWRARLHRLEAARHVLVVTCHHLICDGWSLSLLAEELATLYRAARADQEPELLPLRLQYTDYAVWQQRWLRGSEVAGMESRRAKCLGTPPPLPLPRPRPVTPVLRGAQHVLRIGPDCLAALDHLAKSSGVTRFSVLLAAWVQLLGRRTGANEVWVGVPVANRDRPELQALIGLFANMVVVRARPGPDFGTVLSGVFAELLEALDYQALPFERLVECLRPKRFDAHTPLIRTAVTLQDPLPEQSMGDVRVRFEPSHTGFVTLDVLLVARPEGDGLKCTIEHAVDVLGAAEVADWAIELQQILTEITRPARTNLTPAQLAMWLGEQIASGSPAYHQLLVCELLGPLDTARLDRAFQQVVDDCDALRTVLEVREGVPRQRWLDRGAARLKTSLLDLSRQLDADLQQTIEAHGAAPFSAGELLIRSFVVRLGPARHVWALCLHHLITDAWSFALVLRYTAEQYRNLEPRTRPSFADHIAAQMRCADREVVQRARAWWQAYLDPPPPRPVLLGRTRTPSSTAVLRRRARTNEALDQLSSRPELADLTPVLSVGHALAALLGLLVWQLSGEREICIGVPLHNRGSRTAKEVIGACMVVCPLRLTIDPDQSFIALAASVRDQTRDLLRNAASAPAARRPYEVLLNIQAVQLPSDLFDCRLADASLHGAGHAIDTLALHVEPDDVGWRLTLEMNADVFGDAGADLAIDRLRSLIDETLANPERAVVLLGRPSQLETRMFEAFEGSAPYVPVWPAIVDVAATRPDAVAVQAANSAVTYRALVSRSLEWAASLRAEGFGRGARIGIPATRTPEMVAQVLGILAAGAAFVPFEPTAPEVDREARLEAADFALPGLPSSTRAAKWPAPDPADPAYVIHTSGTTGRPRAVLVTHAALANHTRWAVDTFGLAPGDRVLQFASLCFDAAIEEIVPTLCAGATLALRDEAMLATPAHFWIRCAALGITVTDLPTSFWHVVADPYTTVPETWRKGRSRVRLAIIGGEAASPAVVERWLHSGAPSLLNTYGPTEATIVATAQAVTEPSAPIGQTLPGVTAHVLNADGRLATLGVPGELYLGGVGVAVGYHGDPARTAESFVPDPFTKVPSMRMYRTGDRARRRLDGALEYLGRVDRQIKVRGVRVEPSGLEAVLLGHPDVREVAVTARSAPGGTMLVAHFVGDVEPGTLRAWAGTQLVSTMVPHFDRLPAMPRTVSGKPDLRALERRAPEIERDRTATKNPYGDPEVERRLRAIWAELLECDADTVGNDDDFFDLGGHSLLATMLLARTGRAFGIDVPLQQFLDAPTIGALARAIVSADTLGAARYRLPLLRPVIRGAQSPVSFAQRRLWFLDRLDPGNPTWNVPLAFELEGPLAVNQFVAALEQVVHRHEVLRTVFKETPSEPVAEVRAAVRIPTSIQDLRDLPEAERQATVEVRVRESAAHRFNLSEGPLLRLDILRVGDDRHAVVLNCHHIVCDGWSLGILVDELLTLYGVSERGKPLTPLPVQYADYAIWQREIEVMLEPQVTWWLDYLASAPDPRALLPLDSPRPTAAHHRGGLVRITVPASVSAHLEALGRRHSATPFMVLLAAFSTSLMRWTGATDLIVGVPVAGRDTPEVERLIGFFVNTLALRLDLGGDPTFAELLGRVRRTCNAVQSHRWVPFDRVVEALCPERVTGHLPLFAVMFTFLNEPTRKATQCPSLRWTPIDVDRGFANRDLTLRIEPTLEGMTGWLEYDADLFKAATIEGIAERFSRLLEAVVDTPDARLGALDLRTRADLEEDALRRAQRRDTFLSVLRRTRVTEADVVDRPLDFQQPSPRVLEVRHGEVDSVAWATVHRDRVEAALFADGGVLLRGFTLARPQDFAQFCRVFESELMLYEEGSTPRTRLSDHVYTSTEYPADQRIMPHSEMAYAKLWPRRIWFYCAQPAASGGATPLVDTAALYEVLDPSLRDRFKETGVLYLRNFGEGVDLPWTRAFGTEDPVVLETRLRSAGVEYEWRAGGRLRTRQRGPAVCRDPASGRFVWFNSAHMFHVSSLPPPVRKAIESMLSLTELPRHAFYGDGSPIPDEAIAHISAAYDRLCLRFEWRAGDLLMLDNMRWAHGRDPFVGERRVWVAMADPQAAAE